MTGETSLSPRNKVIVFRITNIKDDHVAFSITKKYVIYLEPLHYFISFRMPRTRSRFDLEQIYRVLYRPRKTYFVF